MEHRDKCKRTSDIAREQSIHSKQRCKDNQREPVSCQCAQLFDTSFPYQDLPPPAPPDGRNDLWELQFCRWWGWNWVRKRESEPKNNEPKNHEQKKTCLSKCRSKSNKHSSAKDKSETRHVPAHAKKASFSSEEPEIRPCPQPHITATQQFKAMCKCLLGKKNTPSGMVKLYNTPSNSTVGVTKHERLSYGVVDKSTATSCKDPRCKKSGRDKKREERPQVKSSCRSKPEIESTTPMSESTTCNVASESVSTQRQESSTEESVEYLTVRLQHMTSDSACPCQQHIPPPKEQHMTSNSACPCQQHIPPPKEQHMTSDSACPCQQHIPPPNEQHMKSNGACPCQQHIPPPKEQVSVANMEDQIESEVPIVNRCSQETQTSGAVEKHRGTSTNNALCSEQLIKLKGKKHKTICIMVCCCGSCKKNETYATKEHFNNSYTQPSDDYQPHAKVPPEKDDEINGLLYGDCTFENDVSTFPVTVPLVSSKKLSKFGTPSKNYPWMQETVSAATTTSLNNIGKSLSPPNDVYEWLNLDFDINSPTQILKLPDITEDLSFLKKLDTSSKSNADDRILLDAVCDAILQDRENETSQYLDEFKFRSELKRNYRDLGVLCDLKTNDNFKTDVFTELSSILINSEDIGVQLSKTSNVHSILEHRDVNSLDTMMHSIMDNIYSKSQDEIKSCPNSKNEYKLENELKQSRENMNATIGKYNFKFTGKDPAITRRHLLPVETFSVFRKTAKRGATVLDKEDNECKKKMKQDVKICLEKVEEKATDRIGLIFSKIEDIVHKSKVKTAEIQQVYSFTPEKKELREYSENTLEKNSLSESKLKLDSLRSSIDNFELPKNMLKRNYPMSSDTFKGTICDDLAKHFDYKNMKNNYNLTSDNASPPHQVFGVKDKDDKQKYSDNTNTAKKMISNLSVHSFLVCDETSTEESKFSKPNSCGIKLGKKSLKKKNCSKGSLIPIRKHSR